MIQSLTQFLAAPSTNNRKQRRRRELGIDRATRLSLERLEDRAMPSVDFTAMAPKLGSDLDTVYAVVLAAATTKVPIINKALSDIPEVRSVLDKAAPVRAKLKSTLEAIGSTSDETAVRTAIWTALGPGGLNVIGDTDGVGGVKDIDVKVHFTGDNNVEVEFLLTKSFTVSSDFGIGLPGMPLQTDAATGGAVQLTGTFDYKNLDFGFQDGAFFFKTDAADEIQITLGATLKDGLTLGGRIGFLEMTAQDGAQDATDPTKTDTTHRTFFGPKLTADVTGSAGSLAVATPKLSGNADVYLKLAATFGGAAKTSIKFPSIYSDFEMHWSFSNANANASLNTFGDAPTIEFKNVNMGLGTFVSDILGPIVTDIQKVTKPIQPIIDVLNKPLPGISDVSKAVGLGDVSLMTLAGVLESTGKVPSPYDILLSLATELVKLVDLVDKVKPGSTLYVPFGGFDLGTSDPRGLTPVGDIKGLALTTNKLTDLIPNAASFDVDKWINDRLGGTPLGDALKDVRSKMASLNTGIELKFPLLDNPTQGLFQLLLGQDPDLVSFKAVLSAHGTADQSLPFYGPLSVGLAGTVDADAYFRIAYDTYGLREFIKSPKDVGKLADGLYVDTSTDLLKLNAGIGAKAEATVGLFGADVTGEIKGNLKIALLEDPAKGDGDTRLRLFKELGKNFARTEGKVTADLSASVRVGISVLGKFIGVEKTFTLATTTLLDLSSGFLVNPLEPPPMKLATVSGGTLTLLMGSLGNRITRGGGKEFVDIINEVFTVSHVSGSPTSAGGETVEVSAFGLSQDFSGVKRIVAYGDSGDDTILVDKEVLSNATLHGGAGNDQLTYLGAGSATLYGDAGNDMLTVAGNASSIPTSTDRLYGGVGNDELHGGAGANYLYGELGDDVLVGGTGHNFLYGSYGNDRLIAGPGADLLNGAAGDDQLIAGAGSDTIQPGDGKNVIRWQVGNGNAIIDGIIGVAAPSLVENTLQMIGSDDADTFTVDPKGKGVIVHAPALRTVSGTHIDRLAIDGGKNADSITVNYLGGTTIKEVGINLGDKVNPDGVPDTIIVNASAATGTENLSVETEEVTVIDAFRKTGGVMKLTGFAGDVKGQGYTVRAMNVADDLTLNALNGNNSIRVLGITGPTTVNGGSAADTITVGSNTVVPSKTLSDIMGLLTVNGQDGADKLIVNDIAAVTDETYTITDSVVKRTAAKGQVAYATVEDLQVTTGSGDDIVNVLSTPVGIPLHLSTPLGQDAINVGDAGTVDKIKGPLFVTNPASYSTLDVDDSANPGSGGGNLGGKTVSLMVDPATGMGAIHGLAPADILFQQKDLKQLVLRGGAGGNVFDVFNTPANPFPVLTSILAGSGNDRVIIEAAKGALAVDGGLGNNTLIRPNGTNTWTITPVGTGAVAGTSIGSYVTFSGIQNLIGGSGADTLVGPNTVNTWHITGLDSGALNSSLSFSQFEKLTGGTNQDTFVFDAGVAFSGKIDGGAGIDTLDYSAYTTNVSVDLPSGVATGTAAVSGIENVTGGSGDDLLRGDAGINVLNGGGGNNILIGNDGDDLLLGGSGRDLLIGGLGADRLEAGSEDDILVAGTTIYDFNDAALHDLMTEWVRVDLNYGQRIANLTAGVGPSASRLHSTTVFNDVSVDELYGQEGLDWFWIEPGVDLIPDRLASEFVNGP
jgi:Ca2+-binding RTX toxin-like protein